MDYKRRLSTVCTAGMIGLVVAVLLGRAHGLTAGGPIVTMGLAIAGYFVLGGVTAVIVYYLVPRK